MRISDWSSDVCSSDLTPGRAASTRYPADAHHTPRPCPSRHRDARFGARAAAGGTVMSKLKLGPIDDDKPVKLTLELPASVHRDLIAYARVHAAQTALSQPLPVQPLIAPMLDRFMATGPGFCRNRSQSGSKSD